MTIFISKQGILPGIERHYIIIKELIHQEDITILSETAHNIRTSKHRKQNQ